MIEPFTVYRRTDRENSSTPKYLWYVQYRDQTTGERMTKKSLNSLNRKLNGVNAPDIKTKAQAYKIALAALDRGLITQLQTGDILFSEYATKVWLRYFRLYQEEKQGQGKFHLP